MKKIKKVIGLTSVFFFVLICVQFIILSIYKTNNVNEINLSYNRPLFLGFCMLISGLLVLFEKDFRDKILSPIAVSLYIIGGLIYIINNDQLDNVIYIAVICFIFASIIVLYNIYKKYQTKKY